MKIQSLHKCSWLLLFSFFAVFLVGCSHLGDFSYETRAYQKAFCSYSSSLYCSEPESYVARSKYAMIASESLPASKIGVEVLKRGGNAIDAAIAVSFALAVHRPQATGIGGGGFLLYFNSRTGSSEFLDFRERAPAQLKVASLYSTDKITGLPNSRLGGRSVGIPGLVRGLFELYLSKGSGKISWQELVLPSASLAAQGYPVYPHLEFAINWMQEQKLLERFPRTRELLSRNNKLLKAGDVFKNKALAKSLREIAAYGPAPMYSGSIASQLVQAVRDDGGTLSKADLRNYQPVYRAPIRFSYRGYRVLSSPPPSSGGIALAQILRGFDAQSKSKSTREVKLVQAMEHAFMNRQKFLGDPDFVRVPQEKLLSEDVKNTSHFVVVDKDGNVVSSTQSVNFFFGSGMLAGNSGIFLNNTLDDFSSASNTFGLAGGVPNKPEANKTPLSSMTPTILLKDSDFYMALGSPGGPKIITAISQVVLNSLDRNYSLPEAIFAPRIHNQWWPEEVIVDRGGVSKEPLNSLPHAFKESSYGVGCISAVQKTKGGLVGVSDPRREPGPVGY